MLRCLVGFVFPLFSPYAWAFIFLLY
jgi:hypothetical protein